MLEAGAFDGISVQNHSPSGDRCQVRPKRQIDMSPSP